MSKPETFTLTTAVDHLDAEIAVGNGIYAAVKGLEVLNESEREGILEILNGNTARLQAIRDGINKLRKS
jgi:hypothetical protein